MRGRLIGAAAGALLVAMTGAAPASASLVGINWYTVWRGTGNPEGYVADYLAQPGETNTVTTNYEGFGHVLRFKDSTALIDPVNVPVHGCGCPVEIEHSDDHCVVTPPHEARCVLPSPESWALMGHPEWLQHPPYLWASVSLGDGNDRYDWGGGTDPTTVFVSGGTGNDHIVLGRGAESGAWGDDGDDYIRNDSSTDARIEGGLGNDTIDAANGRKDTITCDRQFYTDGGTADVANVDAIDVVQPDCETVNVLR